MNSNKPQKPQLNIGAVSNSAASQQEPNWEDEDLYDDEYCADTECEKCGRNYNEIDYEFQSCSKCGWDASGGTWTKPIEPSH